MCLPNRATQLTTLRGTKLTASRGFGICQYCALPLVVKGPLLPGRMGCATSIPVTCLFHLPPISFAVLPALYCPYIVLRFIFNWKLSISHFMGNYLTWNQIRHIIDCVPTKNRLYYNFLISLPPTLCVNISTHSFVCLIVVELVLSNFSLLYFRLQQRTRVSITMRQKDDCVIS